MTPADIARLRQIVDERRALAEAAEAALRRAEAEEKIAAILAALDLYDGALSARANALDYDLRRYLATAWPREREQSLLAETASLKRRALHRIARSRDGEGLKSRRIFDIAKNCNQERWRLQKEPCDSRRRERECRHGDL